MTTEPTGHLPECKCNAAKCPPDCYRCVCDVIRGCEARQYGKAWGDLQKTRHLDYQQGYAAALDAARDAVERVGQQHPKWDLMSTHYEGCWKHHSECALTLALDVIDALRGESNV